MERFFLSNSSRWLLKFECIYLPRSSILSINCIFGPLVFDTIVEWLTFPGWKRSASRLLTPSTQLTSMRNKWLFWTTSGHWLSGWCCYSQKPIFYLEFIFYFSKCKINMNFFCVFTITGILVHVRLECTVMKIREKK